MNREVSRRRFFRSAFGLAALVGVTPILAACGAATPTSVPAPKAAADKPAEKAAGSTPAASGAPAKAATGAEIVYLNQSRGQFKAITTQAEKFSAATGIKVSIDSPGPVDYPKKLQAASQAGNMPDTFYALGSAEMAPYYKAGFALNLKAEMDKGWKKNFQPTILELLEWREGNAFAIPPGIYHAPWEAVSFATLYNPAHFEKAKLDPQKTPQTTQQFVDALKQLKTAGIGPFAVADTNIPQFIQHYVSNWLTDAEIDAVHAGKSPWKSEGYTKALQLFVDMRDAGAVFNNTLNTNNPDLEKSFFNVNELGAFYTGVYSIPVQVTTAPNFTAYSAFPVPKAADAKTEVRSPGGPGKNGVVNPKSKFVDQSLQFVKWLTEKEQALIFMAEVPLVSPNPEVDASKMLPQLKMFAAGLEKLQKVVTSRTGPVNEAFVKGVQSILLKEKTIEQVLNDADKAQKG